MKGILTNRVPPTARRTMMSAAVLMFAFKEAAWAQSAVPVSDASAAAVSTAPVNGTPHDSTQYGVQVQDRVVVTGTRTSTKASQSLTPVDVITSSQLQATGATSLRDALVQLSPSIARQALPTDGAALTDALTLHGLTPDHVLVLVNGKRRHPTATITQDAGPQAGSTGVDIDLIPVGLIDHIEILRDGAAAQYGSDAIAGVINIILKSSTEGGSIEDTVGQTYQGDGLTNNVSVSKGLALGDRGYLDLSTEYARQNHTNRTGFDNDFGHAPAGIPNAIEGDPSSTREVVGFNSGYHLDDDVELYGFGTYGHRNAAAYENARPSFYIPSVFPNGFTPQDTLDENDYSITGGAKGHDLFGWSWDVSSTYGGDHANVGLVDSVNPGLYAATGYTPTSFHIGTQNSTQWTNNLDFSHPFHLLLPESMTVSAGFEQRRETYSIGAGDPATYLFGGTQALSGYMPASAGSFSRDVEGVYVDLAGKLTPQWRFDLSGRFDHYSDAGNTTNGKISTRYDFSPAIALRGSISTGFRAPSLADEYLTNMTVSAVSASGLLAANSAAARSIGAQPLKPEKSTNVDIGLVLNPISRLNITLDAYRIDLRDRIVEGGTASGQSAIDAIGLAGISLPNVPPAAVSANYFTNGANTQTTGLDLVATYHSNLGAYGRIDWDLGLNLNTTSVTHVGIGANGQPELNQQEIGYLTTETPKNKLILGGNWHWSKWAVSLHETRYGATHSYMTYWSGPNAFSTTQFLYFKNTAKYITDLEMSYDVTKKFEIAVGANNLFNVHPNTLPTDAQFEGLQFDWYGSQISPSGGFYYARARYLF
jgi:iron complex outermembrane recepter protein